MHILVTGYNNMDLDGAACAYAYAEFLNYQKIPAMAGIFGHLSKEVGFVFHEFNIPSLQNANSLKFKQVVLVDASDSRWVSGKINPAQVIEVIDHRSVCDVGKFINAKIKIELVGAAATLIAEKFFRDQIPLSMESAALLYSAIISNTINFQAAVTTDKDHKMVNLLQTKFTLPSDYIHRMFTYKSKFDKSIKEELLEFIGINENLSGHQIGIVQWEIIEAKKFIQDNLAEIKTELLAIKQEKNLNFIFLTCIDINLGLNIFVAVDEQSRELVEHTLDVKFNDDLTTRHGVIMRKEIWPLVKKYLTS